MSTSIISILGVLNKYWTIFDSSEREIFCNIIKSIIPDVAKLSDNVRESLKNIVEKCLIQHIDFQMTNLCAYLIPDYKWDKIMEFYEIESAGDVPPMPVEEKIQMEKLAILRFTQRKLAKKAKEAQVFKLHQLVTATDSSGSKWVARVLDIYTDKEMERSWYYVHYENMDESFNEWITPPYRISKYNPHIAKYYE